MTNNDKPYKGNPKEYPNSVPHIPYDETLMLYEGEIIETGTSNNQDIEITSDGTVGIPRSLSDRLGLF